MAQFLALIPMTAGNFDSESATDGHVLTADGSGGAAWEEGGGGGGASFAFDGATFTPGTFTADSGTRDITIELTKGGNAITSGTFMFHVVATTDATLVYGANNITGGLNTSDIARIDNYHCFVSANAGHVTGMWTFATDEIEAFDIYFHVILPDGSVITSDAISIPGVGE